MIFITKFPTPAIVTFASIGCAVAGLGLASTHVGWAYALLLACAVLDILDGRFARLFARSRSERAFGIAIDSLADVLAFVALPVILYVSLTRSLVIPVVYALAGITRLAVFSSLADPDAPTRYYRGLPVTVAGLVIPAVYALSRITSGIDLAVAMSVVYVVLAALFVLDFKVRKP